MLTQKLLCECHSQKIGISLDVLQQECLNRLLRTDPRNSSAIKRNKLSIHTTWMNLQLIILSEKKAIPKSYILYDLIYIIFLNRTYVRNGNRIEAAKG